MNNLHNHPPSELGYGASGSPPKIPGNSVLVFEVAILKICLLPDYKEILSFVTILYLQVELVKIERKGEL